MIGLAEMRRRLQAARCRPETPGRRVLVLGAGFGGVYATLYLDQDLRDEEGVEISLISDTNFLLFNPLVVEVATGALESVVIIGIGTMLAYHPNFLLGRGG